jgi:hypothetical protein
MEISIGDPKEERDTGAGRLPKIDAEYRRPPYSTEFEIVIGNTIHRVRFITSR